MSCGTSCLFPQLIELLFLSAVTKVCTWFQFGCPQLCWRLLRMAALTGKFGKGQGDVTMATMMFHHQRQEWNHGRSSSLQRSRPASISVSAWLLPSLPDRAPCACTPHTSCFSPCATARCFEDMPPARCACAVETHTGTHAVSQQRSLINEMVRSLLQASANQAGGHKSLPAGDAEGHRPLFMGNLSPDYPNRQRNMVTRTQLPCSLLSLLNLTAVANTSANVMKSQHQRTLHMKQHKLTDPLNILVSGRVSRLEALKPKTHQSCAQIRTSHLKRMMSFKYLHRIIPSILNTQDLISRIQQAWCFRSSVKHY